jgi:potassium-transporting ATPase KdpC subunit
LLVLTVILGIAYPAFVYGIGQIPGLRGHANGSLVKVGDTTVASSIIGQGFVDKDGKPMVQYFQTRPSKAGTGWDPTATAASNLGPENVVDTLPDPSNRNATGTQSLLTQVCSRSVAIGQLEGASGARPYCTPGGVGAVLAVFYQNGSTGPITRVVSLNEECPATPFLATYQGVTVECATFGEDYSHGVVTPVRGDAPSRPAVPSDAVTASGSGLDPQISQAYAQLQAPRVARARGLDLSTVEKLIGDNTTGRALGFLGEPSVNVVTLNVSLDQQYPYHKPA